MGPVIFWASLPVTLVVGIAIGITIARFRAAGSATPQQPTYALVMQDELCDALARDQFVLHYQPKMELCTGRVSCLEALVRWQHPERGLLMPSEFLPVAAQHLELMGSLTSWVLRRGLADYTAWTAVGRDWTVAVNISAADLGSLEFADTVGQILAKESAPSGGDRWRLGSGDRWAGRGCCSRFGRSSRRGRRRTGTAGGRMPARLPPLPSAKPAALIS
jgi:sensor c-di-GMP phosphodiesterase-like protein